MTQETPATTAPRKRGRPRKYPPRVTPRAKKRPASEALEKVRSALGIERNSFVRLLNIHDKTIDEWIKRGRLTTYAVNRLVKYARVNPAWLSGRSDVMFLNNQTDADVASATKEVASGILTAFVSALTDAEKKYAADLARALNG